MTLMCADVVDRRTGRTNRLLLGALLVIALVSSFTYYSMSTETENLKMSLNHVKDQLHRSSTEVRDKREEINRVQMYAQTLQANKSRAEELSFKLNNELQYARQAYEQLQTDVQEKDDEIQSLRQEFGNDASQIDELEGKVSLLSRQLDEERSIRQSIEMSNQQSKAEVIKIMEELRDTEDTCKSVSLLNEEQKQQIQIDMEEISRLSSALNEANVNYNTVSVALEENRQLYQQATNNLNACQYGLQKLREEIQRREQEAAQETIKNQDQVAAAAVQDIPVGEENDNQLVGRNKIQQDEQKWLIKDVPRTDQEEMVLPEEAEAPVKDDSIVPEVNNEIPQHNIEQKQPNIEPQLDNREQQQTVEEQHQQPMLIQNDNSVGENVQQSENEKERLQEQEQMQIPMPFNIKSQENIQQQEDDDRQQNGVQGVPLQPQQLEVPENQSKPDTANPLLYQGEEVQQGEAKYGIEGSRNEEMSEDKFGELNKEHNLPEQEDLSINHKFEQKEITEDNGVSDDNEADKGDAGNQQKTIIDEDQHDTGNTKADEEKETQDTENTDDEEDKKEDTEDTEDTDDEKDTQDTENTDDEEDKKEDTEDTENTDDEEDRKEDTEDTEDTDDEEDTQDTEDTDDEDKEEAQDTENTDDEKDEKNKTDGEDEDDTDDTEEDTAEEDTMDGKETTDTENEDTDTEDTEDEDEDTETKEK